MVPLAARCLWCLLVPLAARSSVGSRGDALYLGGGSNAESVTEAAHHLHYVGFRKGAYFAGRQGSSPLISAALPAVVAAPTEHFHCCDRNRVLIPGFQNPHHLSPQE